MTTFFIILIICVLLYVCSFSFRLIIHNPFNILKYIIFDIRSWYRYKNIPKKPFINCYVGLFGMGKTLSAVHDVIEFYNTYNNKRVFDDRINEWVIQKVFVLSNVHINSIKYRYLKSLSQLNNIAKWRHITDAKHKTRTITICLIDEASTQLNSRNFKSNISSQFLNTLLTSRHALIHGFYLTSQRFGHMDALLRQVTSNVISCEKHWRFQKQTYFDAWEYENAARPADCSVKLTTGFFVSDQDYAAYNTLAVVEHLIKDQEEGKMQSDEKILEQRGSKTVFYAQDQKKKRRKK